MTNNSKRHVVKKPREEKLVFYADKKQAQVVFDAMIQRLIARGQPYNHALVPQAESFIPTNLVRGSREHAIFLFMLCLWMRGGVESNTATMFLKSMYEARPDLFDPYGYMTGQTEYQIQKITKELTEHRLGQRVDENSKGWVYNMQKLARFWNGDPRNLMNDQPTFAVLTQRIRSQNNKQNNEHDPNGFMFFREKMVAMIAYFLMNADLVQIFYTPVPVDFHVLRLLTSNKICCYKDRLILYLTRQFLSGFMGEIPKRLKRALNKSFGNGRWCVEEKSMEFEFSNSIRFKRKIPIRFIGRKKTLEIIRIKPKAKFNLNNLT